VAKTREFRSLYLYKKAVLLDLLYMAADYLAFLQIGKSENGWLVLSPGFRTEGHLNLLIFNVDTTSEKVRCWKKR
jgi:hypothetical protein